MNNINGMVSFEDYLKNVSDYMQEHDNIRLGQALFTVFHQLEPDLARSLTGTALDPFYAPYSDPVINQFLMMVQKHFAAMETINCGLLESYCHVTNLSV